jgi:hypothetical protein
MKQKLISLFCYAAAALATANWLDYGLTEEYGHKALMQIAVAGSVAFGVGCLASLFRIRYGIIFGVVGACLTWPYFILLMTALPWSNLNRLVRVQYHGRDEIVALLCLLVATSYTIIERRWMLLSG